MGLCAYLYHWVRDHKLIVIFLLVIIAFLQEFHFETLTGYLYPKHRINHLITEDASHLRSNLVSLLDTSHAPVDLHLEHPVLGHTGEVLAHNVTKAAVGPVTVAVGGGITSRKVKDYTEANIPQKFQFFFTLLPSFCKTASSDIHYHFYLAFDVNDVFFNNEKMRAAFNNHFMNAVSSKCQPFTHLPSLHLVQCSHHGKPAWAQNDAMHEAYLDDIQYYYRINDDSLLQTGNWTHRFINTLSKYNPKNVGVVGPNHAGGNTDILTYDFLHFTHFEVFGFYYPRLFTDWYADDWVTRVYEPGRMTKVRDIKLVHTMKLGVRYNVDFSIGKLMGARIKYDKVTLNRYLKYRQEHPTPPKPDGSMVISMSLYGKNPRYTMGAIRYAQLLPVHMPEWNLRVYVPGADTPTTEWIVPPRVLSKLRLLGVDIVHVNRTDIPPRYWRYLVADDNNVEVFLIRDADMRPNDREATAVNHWLQNWQPVHCIRDHPSHANYSLVEGLWGARSGPEGIQSILGLPMSVLLRSDSSELQEKLKAKMNSTSNIDMLRNLLWTLIQGNLYCHDSVSCQNWPGAHKFPVTNRLEQTPYVGEKFMPYEVPVNGLLRKGLNPGVPRCLGAETPVDAKPQAVLESKASPATTQNLTVQNATVRSNTTRTPTTPKH